MEARTSPSWLTVVHRVVVFGLMCGLALSVPLWVGKRFFPKVPLLVELALPGSLEWVLFALLWIALFCCSLWPYSRKFLFSVPVVLAVFFLTDQNRLNASLYFYFALFLLFGAASLLEKTEEQERRIRNTLRICIIGLYFWSGAHKISIAFVSSTIPWLLQPLLTEEIVNDFLALGLCVPFIEAMIALFLWTHRFRKVGVVLAVGMHVFILLSLGPLGHNYNEMIWPWNIVMCLLVLLLFWKSEDSDGMRAVFQNGIRRIHTVAILFFLILPSFHLVGLWDTYPSFSLYTPNPFGTLRMSKDVRSEFPDSLSSLIEEEPSFSTISLLHWSEHELGTPIYPEKRMYIGVFRKLCQRWPRAKMLDLVLIDRPKRWTGKREREVFSCIDVLSSFFPVQTEKKIGL